MTEAIEFLLPKLEDTDRFGHRLAALIFPGAVIGLIGSLGAGKTHLTRAIVAGLGGDPRQVSSPTFTLIHEYRAGIPVFHFDAYRLKTSREFLDLGVHEYFEGGGVCLVEWADLVTGALPVDRLDVHLRATGATSRLARLVAGGAMHVQLLAAGAT
jgi:tRNA threonylcarbamoyladenosine biosynthesis protein TsaE